MAAKHKYSNAHMNIATQMSAEHVASICQQMAEHVQGVRMEGATAGSVHFSIRGLMGRSELMTFRVDISDASTGCTVVSEIERFKTTQQTYMFIPVSPKSLLGYGSYKKYLKAVADAVAQNDPTSTSLYVDRPEMAGR